MPQGDRTGPMGLGPRTGRGMGFCSGFNGSGYMNPGFRRGVGFGRGHGRGFRRGFGWRWRIAPFAEPAWEQAYPTQAVQPYQPAQPTKEQEKQMLEQEAKEIEEEEKALKQEKESIKKRLEEFD